MAKNKPQRLAITSADVVDERINELKQIFPDAFAEGKIDFDKLKAALGDLDALDAGPERYGLSWAGKADAIRCLQIPSVGTLVPDVKASVNFDATENLFIEGDNLEVLKLLQKSYHGKVKMIYIDPPYNTGNEFIYPDNFKEGLDTYLKYSGQVDDEGLRISTKTEKSGRYHSNWLNMMYPRLFLAKNLLQKDGVVFISIDENEVYNLRAMCDEIFGEECFVEQIVWKNKYGAGAATKGFISIHEYILCYSRLPITNIQAALSESEIQKHNKQDRKFNIRGPYRTQPVQTKSLGDRPNLVYPVKYKGQEIWPNKQWVWSEERMLRAIKNDEVEFTKADGKYNIRSKQYLKDENGRIRKGKPLSLLNGPFTQEGTKEIRELFPEDVFPFPKPSALIKYLLSLVINEEEENDYIVLDFFSGSCTTAHAVLEMNKQDGGNRKFIMVQLPEKCDENSEAFRTGYKTISDIGRERIRRVIKKIQKEQAEENKKLIKEDKPPLDLGFKAFRLTGSNFKIWNADEAPKDTNGLETQLKLYAENVLPDRSELDILYEIILKAGLSLTAKVEKRKIARKTAYSIEDGVMLICLEERLTQGLLRGIIELSPKVVIVLDKGFASDDKLKTNTVLEMKSHKIEFKTV